MQFVTRRLLAAGCAICAIVLLYHSTAEAETFLNINFDDQNDGEAVVTDTNTTQPITHVYAQGGFPDTPPLTGATTIGSPAPLTKAAVMTTTQGGIGAQYLDTQFIKIADLITLDFDLNVMDIPTTGLPQATTSAPDGQAFVIQAFNASNSDRVWRFAVTPTSATGGNFGMRNNTDGDLIVFGAYTEGQTNHLSIAADYTSNLVSVSLNGLPALTVPFISPSTGMAEYFIFQNGIEGQTNQVAVDNLVSTAVPEPSTCCLLACGMAAAVAGLVRRRIYG